MLRRAPSIVVLVGLLPGMVNLEIWAWILPMQGNWYLFCRCGLWWIWISRPRLTLKYYIRKVITMGA